MRRTRMHTDPYVRLMQLTLSPAVLRHKHTATTVELGVVRVSLSRKDDTWIAMLYAAETNELVLTEHDRFANAWGAYRGLVASLRDLEMLD